MGLFYKVSCPPPLHAIVFMWKQDVFLMKNHFSSGGTENNFSMFCTLSPIPTVKTSAGLLQSTIHFPLTIFHGMFWLQSWESWLRIMKSWLNLRSRDFLLDVVGEERYSLMNQVKFLRSYLILVFILTNYFKPSLAFIVVGKGSRSLAFKLLDQSECKNQGLM